jgi:glutamate synthase domain-containing protein 2
MQSIFFLLALLGIALIACLYFFAGWHSYVLDGFIAIFILLGLHDIFFSTRNLNRNYPIAAYLRHILEYIRPEIRQYFIASDTDERPFNREQRSMVYQRAKQMPDTIPFGTEHDIKKTGYLSAHHSLAPKEINKDRHRVIVGGSECKQPYSSSRLNISAMSFGALSSRAIMALNKGAAIGGFAHNTGEGGLSKYHLWGGGDITWQIGTGYFGCRDKKNGTFDPAQFKDKSAHPHVKMIEIKLSQGAKPSHGGVLPAAKVSKEIAEIRGVPMGEDCISPPAHSAFSTPIGLMEYVAQLRELSQGKPVGFKLCVGVPEEFMAICKAMLKTGIYPDFITIDGAEGGTGAAPVEFTDRLGMPCLDGVSFVHNTLLGINVRDKLKLIASGKTASGFDMLTKIAYGANICNAARTMMLSVGCLQSRACNTNKCPTGVATQNKIRGLAVNVGIKSKRASHFHEATVSSFLALVGAMGLDDPDNLSLKHIVRQNGDDNSVRCDRLYPTLEPGQLLANDGPIQFLEHWQLAVADRFQ